MKRLIALWAAVMVLALPQAFAASARTGSVTVRMLHQGEAVPEGSITLYRLAVRSSDGRYLPEPEFEACPVELNTGFTPANAEMLADYTAENRIQGQTRSLGLDGTAVFSPLDTGLYLLVQQETGRGYLPIRPFFIGVPQSIGGELVYDVDASPKCAPEPTEPTAPGTPGIPQTGQLNWPVPVMAGLGFLLFAAGGLLWFPTGRDGDEP